MNSLLPNDNDYKIILLEEKKNNGHWVVVIRQKGKFYYFNSYGSKYDNDLFIIPRLTRCILGESRMEFKRLLDGGSMDWNKQKFQGKTSSTCGRWCCLFVIYTTKLGFTPKQTIDFMKEKYSWQRATLAVTIESAVQTW